MSDPTVPASLPRRNAATTASSVRIRRVDALAGEVELLDPVDHHDQLPVEYKAVGRQGADGGQDLREVAVHRAAVPALEVDVVAVAEHDRPEAVPLRLEAPAVAV